MTLTIDTSDRKALLDTIQRQHRTHQQQLISMLAETLLSYADAPVDGRNAYARDFCSSLREVALSSLPVEADRDADGAVVPGSVRVWMPYI